MKVVLGKKLTSRRVDRAAAVTIADPPRVVGVLPIAVAQDVTAFVERNREVLLRHWAGEIDSGEIAEQLCQWSKCQPTQTSCPP